MKRQIIREELPFLPIEALDRLSELVAIARRQRGWTQADLAAKSEVGLSTVVEIEKGSPRVQFGHWLKVLWAVDQVERLIKFSRPLEDEAGVDLMIQQLPKRVRSPRTATVA